MTQKKSPQLLPASAVSALSETAKLRSVRGSPSYILGICLLPISQVTDTYSYIKITQGFSSWFFHSLKPLFHQHLKFVTRYRRERSLTKHQEYTAHLKNRWTSEWQKEQWTWGQQVWGSYLTFLCLNFPLLESGDHNSNQRVAGRTKWDNICKVLRKALGSINISYSYFLYYHYHWVCYLLPIECISSFNMHRKHSEWRGRVLAKCRLIY